MAPDPADLIVVGAGAAGLATAIFAARQAPRLRVQCVDGARRPGAKILVSGGSRCNVTNRHVDASDFWGGPSRVVRHVLRAFSAEHAAAFFESIGVPLHEEADGKLFPDSNRSRTVLDALLRELERAGVSLVTAARVLDVRADAGMFQVETDRECRLARAVVLATGGRSLPKTGSDGFGYTLAARAGHGCVDTTPALAPLVLEGERHRALSGVSHLAALTVRVDGATSIRLAGSLLWTHFGISGPVALDLSRHWHRAQLEGRRIEVLINVCPDETFESLESSLLDEERRHPRAQLATVVARHVPAAVAHAWLVAEHLDPTMTLAHLRRDARRQLVRALLETRLIVNDSRGYTFAEVTAGGIPLEEVDPATMESRRQRGLYLVGEILDVDGRLGGFNFQWAWSSAYVAGTAIARALGEAPQPASGDV